MIEQCKMKNAACHFAFCIIFLATNLLAPTVARGQQSEPPKFVGVRVGIADRYKVGLWTQVEVTLQGGSEPVSGEVSLIVPDGDGVPSRVSTPPDDPCQLMPGRETTVRLLCRLGRVHCAMTAEFCIDGNIVTRRTFQTAPRADAVHFLPGLEFRSLIVTVGDSALPVEDIGKLSGVEVEYRPVAAHVEDVRSLPTHWCGYEGIDAVILSTSRPEIFHNLTMHGPRIRALDEWVRMGGRLVLCVGAQAEAILAPDAPLAPFVPGRLESIVSLRQTGALESYCRSRTGVPRTGGAKSALRVPRLADLQGVVEAHEADLPLVVRTARGFGQIIFVAADLDRPPLDAWTDRSMLIASLLDMPTGVGEESDESTAMMHFGYSDMAGQLRSALDRFDGVRLAPFWLVAALTVAYLLLIGPGDYFFLRKMVGQMQWTWVTFPLIVLLACLGAYFLAYQFKGNALKVTQADVVDVDAASGLIRGATWFDIFSPRTETFDLSMDPRLPEGGKPDDAHVWMAWLGLPGTAIGGMNHRAGQSALWTTPYCFSPNLDAMRGVPVSMWSTKSFCARWNASTRADTDNTKIFPQADLTDDNQLLIGTVINTFDFPLDQCILAYGRSVYELGTIDPGKAARLGPMSKRSELKTLLTGRKVVFTDSGDKYQQETTPYDQSSTDVPYILRMMMFYDAAGGRRYTGLWNAYQSYVDLSTLLKADRAILVAQAPNTPQNNFRGASLLRNGRPLDGSNTRHVTMVRIVFPVKRGE